MTAPWTSNVKPVDAETADWVLAAHRKEEAERALAEAQRALIAKPSEEARQAKLRETHAVQRAVLGRGRETAARNRRIRHLHTVEGLEPDLLAERFDLDRNSIYAILKQRPETG